MEEAGRVFRPGAVRRYNERREETVLPLFGAPRAGRLSWVLLGLFCAALVIASRAEVPTYVHGTVARGEAPDSRGALTPVCLPPESLPQLRVGQQAFIQLGEGAFVHGVVVEVAAPPAGGETARASAVALTRFDWDAFPASARASAADRPARVEVGARPLIPLPGGD